MTKPLIKIHNAETGEIVEREMNDAEFEKYQIEVAAFESQQQAELEAVANRQALLDRLGITAEEARLLLS